MIYLLCRNEDEVLTGIGLELSESAAKALADDGDFVVIPIQVGKMYPNIVNAGIVGAVTFNNTSTKTIVEQARAAILSLISDVNTLQGQITTLQNQIAAGSSAIQALSARITALEEQVT